MRAGRLVLLSEVDDGGLAAAISRSLREVYGLDVEARMVRLEGAERFYNRGRGQYDAAGLISLVSPARDRLFLILTWRDIYVAGLNYVFGYAPGGVGIVSTSRLDQRLYTGEYDPHLYIERSVKEAVHEVGHLLGLSHCPDPLCVMHFSNSIEDTDRKSSRPCTRCMLKI
ncbi:hypothetical protein HRbin01_01399 [archaeon HR01]|nr:hypothetical protein HRbin01_01399 [archaeon HR01]